MGPTAVLDAGVEAVLVLPMVGSLDDDDGDPPEMTDVPESLTDEVEVPADALLRPPPIPTFLG